MFKQEVTKNDAVRELARRELERRMIARKPFYFVENYVWIENKEDTSFTNKVLFKLWHAQKEAWKTIDNNQKTIVPKARQIGITWLALSYAVYHLMQIKGYKAVILSQSLDYATDAIGRVEFILSNLPDWLCQKKTKFNMNTNDIWIYEATTKYVKIWHPLESGKPREYSEISARPSTKGAGRSLTADLLIFDEWAYHEEATKVFDAAYPIINSKTGNTKFIGVSTNQRGSFFEQVIQEREQRKFALVFIPWDADPGRTIEWFENTKATLPDSWMQEYPETLEQCMSAGSKTALPEFSRSVHVCKTFDPPKHWPRWMGADNGYDDPFAWYKLTVDESGTVYVYYEYTRRKNEPLTRKHYSEQAEQVAKDSSWMEWDNEQGKEVLRHEKIQYIAIGLDAWSVERRHETGKSYLDYYQPHLKYPFVKPVTNRRLRLATLHEYLKPYEYPLYDTNGRRRYDENGEPMTVKTAKLQIMDCCTELIRTLPLLVKDEKDSEKVADDSSIDNQYDALGYGLITHHRKQSQVAPEVQTPQQQHKAQLIKAAGRKSRKRGTIN